MKSLRFLFLGDAGADAQQPPSRDTVSGGHGRVKIRTLRCADKVAWLTARHAWSQLQSIASVGAVRRVGRSKEVMRTAIRRRN